MKAGKRENDLREDNVSGECIETHLCGMLMHLTKFIPQSIYPTEHLSHRAITPQSREMRRDTIACIGCFE